MEEKRTGKAYWSAMNGFSLAALHSLLFCLGTTWKMFTKVSGQGTSGSRRKGSSISNKKRKRRLRSLVSERGISAVTSASSAGCRRTGERVDGSELLVANGPRQRNLPRKYGSRDKGSTHSTRHTVCLFAGLVTGLASVIKSRTTEERR